jgi:hypothetical protein
MMVAKKPAGKSFAIGFTVPFLYVEPSNDITLDWNGQGSKLVSYHLLGILNQTPGGYIVFMDYRNFADGNDGSIQHAQPLFDYASKNAPNVKIVIGQETTDVAPAKITFFNTSKQEFMAEAEKLLQAFGSYQDFGGIAIHDLPNYINL